MALEVLTAEEPVAPEAGAPEAIVVPKAVFDVLEQQERDVESRSRVALGGVWIDQVDLAGAAERMRGFLASGTHHHVVTVNLDFLSIAERESEFRDLINEADLAVADGMPLVWASQVQGHPLPERVAGVELVDASCRVAEETGHGVFLLGAAPGVAEAAARTLQTRYPRLRIGGVYAPPFGPLTPEEDARIVQMIREAAPGILLVALGAPRQDQWIRAHRRALGVPVAMGVGCVFDLLAGVVDRAPAWMQRAGLEWAFRLGQEPGRLWRRYIVDDLPTFGRLLLESLFAKDPDGDGDQPLGTKPVAPVSIA